jgi:UDP-N-acetylglucosamine pyrophosphorylase
MGFSSGKCIFLIREGHIYRHLSTCKLQAADVVVHELQWNFIMVSAFERKQEKSSLKHNSFSATLDIHSTY